MKKITFPEEIAYLIACIMLGFAVAITAATNLGVGVLNTISFMIAKITSIPVALCEYMVMFFLLILFNIIIRKVRFKFAFCFVTGLVYGGFLWLFQLLPFLNQIASLHVGFRLLIYLGGDALICLSVALFLNAYPYPSIYDYFLKGVTTRYHLNVSVFKVIYDVSFIAISIALSFIFLNTLDYTIVGVGTLLAALVNGVMIGVFTKVLQKIFLFRPFFPKAKQFFLEEELQ